MELALEARYPGHFVPKYAMVTFHRLPYAVALARGRVQDRMLGELCEGITRVEELDYARAEALVQRELAPLDIPPAAEARRRGPRGELQSA